MSTRPSAVGLFVASLAIASACDPGPGDTTDVPMDTDTADAGSTGAGEVDYQCFDRNDVPENDYVDDDPRLTDPEYAWSADALRRGSECVDCHRYPDGMKSPAEVYWDIECQPTWTDSATDESLAKMVEIVVDPDDDRITLDAAERQRVSALIEAELQRRADRR